MTPYTLTWKVTSERSGTDIKTFLAEQKISKRALADIKFSGGFIRVNGHERTVRFTLSPGDVLEVVFPDEPLNEHLKEEYIPLDVLYEDEDLIVINKSAFMSTIPSREHPTGSVANALAHYYKEAGHRAGIHIVTRLDRNTSGLLLAAKHRHAHHLFGMQQRAGAIKREYRAIAAGKPPEKGTIDAPIGRKASSIIEREVSELGKGKRAVTHFEVEEQYIGNALARVRLETGRTHQIRVHFAYIGHPLLGDDLYGGPLGLIDRQALHCSDLAFTHPLKQQEMKFQAPLPADMASVRRHLF